MRIGVIGSGSLGGTLAKLFADQDHEVAVANSRGPESLAELVAEAGDGVRAVSVEHAAAFAEVVIVAIPLHAYTDLPAHAFAGKIVVDAGNYVAARDGQIEVLDRDEATSTEWLAAQLRGSRPVKAFNTMFFETLATEGRPGAERTDRLTLFVAGDDEEAKRIVVELIDELGFAPVDTGSLANGGRLQQPGAPLYNTPLLASAAEAALAA